jgi:hypothetical protein
METAGTATLGFAEVVAVEPATASDRFNRRRPGSPSAAPRLFLAGRFAGRLG